MGWISVKDKLPDTPYPVLVHTYRYLDYKKKVLVCTYIKAYDGFYSVDTGINVSYVSHWMPLPEAPKGE